jgi:hypothetical protein
MLCLLSPLGSLQAQQRFFYDDFEKWRDWVVTDEFEMDTCIGLGTTDPTAPYGGSRVLGVDLTGLGSNPGNYEPNLASRACMAVSPMIDCRNYSGVHLKFQRWLCVGGLAGDTARIEISNDGGGTWQAVWMNGSSVTQDVAWTAQDFNIASLADGHQILLRFSIGGTNASGQYGGWNIDNMELTGTFSCSSSISTAWNDPLESNMDNWYQDGLDDFNWTFASGSTPTPNTGPDAGFNGTSYIYTEANGNLWNTASVISPCLNLSGMADPAINFYYHMYCGFTSDGLGNLYLDIEPVAGSQQWITIWGKEGNHTAQWYKEVVDLSAFKGHSFRLRFRAVLSWSFYSDIALDNISFFDQGGVASPVALSSGGTCPGTATTLTLRQSDEAYNWSSTPGGSILGTGNSFNMPAANSNTTYYIQKPAVSGSSTLFTNYTASYSANGIMFDIVAKNSVNIDSLEIKTTAAAGVQVPLLLMIKNKTYVGSENNAEAWTLHYADTVSSPGPSTPMMLHIKGIQLNNQDTLAIYITGTNPSYNIYHSGYTADYADSNIMIGRSISKDYPFLGSNANRMFNGKIYYSPQSIASNTAAASGKTGFMIKLKTEKAVALEGIDMKLSTTSGSHMAYLYYKTGDHLSYETNANKWILWDSTAYTGIASGISRINFQHELQIPAGEIYSIYVCTPGVLSYSTSGSMNLSNNIIDFLSGTSSDYPFAAGYLTGRALNCRLHYRIINDLTGQVALHVAVPSIAVPAVDDSTICDLHSVSLVVPGAAGPYFWWDAATAGNQLGTGNTYTTPVLTNPGIYHYYVNRQDSQSSASLTTTVSGSLTKRGNMFNITAGATDVMIDSLAFLPATASRYTLQLYYREGGYSGHEQNPGDWHLYSNYFFPSLSASALKNLPMGGLLIPAGTTYGFYLTAQDKDLKCSNSSSPYSDSYITINTGTSNDYPFGTVTTGNAWNGKVYYHTGSTCFGNREDVVVTVLNCSGVSENALSANLSVYPNPNDGLLQISHPGIKGTLELSITDLNGRVIQSNTINCDQCETEQLDLRSLPSGIYILQLRGNEVNKQFKIALQ